MLSQKTVVKIFGFNGNIDEVKVVEVDGKKFVDDGSGKPKVGDDGQPVPFVEKPADVKIDDVAKADLETLAKVNPSLARFLTEKADADKKLADLLTADEEKKRKDAEAKGEWQKIADEERAKRLELEKKLNVSEVQLGKYIGSVESMLKNVLASVPKDKLGLIPKDFSPRQKLEYITENAKALGVKMSASPTGDKLPDNDDKPSVTDEEKLVNEFEELRKKTTRTASEDKIMLEKAQALKQLRAKKKQ